MSKKLFYKDKPKAFPKEVCVASCLKIMGNKWSALILTDLVNGAKRFGEIEDSLEGISPRTLSKRLEEMVEHQILNKTSYAEVPPRVEYELTAKGKDLVPILEQMSDWGTKYPKA